MKLKTLLYLFCGLVTLCLALTGMYARTLLQDLQRISVVETEYDDLYQTLLQMRSHEQNFLGRRDLVYLTRFNDAFEALGVFESFGVGSEVVKLHIAHSDMATIQSHFDSISKKMRAYHAAFNRLAGQVRKIGLTENQGLHNRLRQAVRTLEKGFAGDNDHYQRDLLTLRRDEKNFFQRLDIKYVNQFKVSYADFLKDLKKDPTVASLIPVLHDYLAAFLETAGEHITIGLTYEKGLRGKANNAADDAEFLIQETHQFFDEASKVRALEIYHSLFLLGGLIFLTMVTGVVLLSRWVVGKTNRIIHGIGQIEESENYDLTLPVQGRDEFAAITEALNQMMSKVSAATREIEAAATHNRVILESMIDGLIVIDEQGIIQTFNPAAERIFGYSADEIVDRNISQLMPEPHKSLHDGYLRHYLETGERHIIGLNREVEGLRKDGSHFPMDLSANAMEVGGRQYFAGVVRDITDRKEAERQLVRINAELEQFAYVASHDLQEPLRMVSSYLQLLDRRYTGVLDEKADKYIHYAVDGAARMKILIQDLLAFSRVGRDAPVFERVDTESMLLEVEADLAVAVADSRASIGYDSLPDVYGDAGMIRSLFQNLIGNAIKYRGDAPPHIRIDARREGRFWAFSVEDNGIGIDPQYFERIFGVFQRLHGMGEYGGTGIGLAVCKKIVERHRGKISVASVPGKGSTFHFTLPAVKVVTS